jgi:hypothetical protein
MKFDSWAKAHATLILLTLEHSNQNVLNKDTTINLDS